ncbi:MAG TPA: HEPN domain-containing protein [Patescibacteria group bacterium]|nr:HEPN domain-containing protein [Patescibacteria group bacterium]
MTQKQVLNNLLFTSGKDIKAARDLLRLKHYDWSLFLWHLAVEKILKAKIVSLGKSIFYTHDLVRLAKRAEIKLDKILTAQLDEITTFNIEARYDDYKLSFYKKVTKNYAEKWAKICDKIYILIKTNR